MRQRRVSEDGLKVREVMMTRVLPALRKQNIVARGAFLCCGSCAGYKLGLDMEAAAVKGKPKNGAVYWHKQDDEGLRLDGFLYLGFGTSESGVLTTADVGEIAATECIAAGLTVVWDWTPNTRLLVSLNG